MAIIQTTFKIIYNIAIMDIKQIPIGLLLLMTFGETSQAKDVEPLSFKTPTALIKQKLSTKQDAIALLNSERLHIQLLEIAKKISASNQKKLSMDNEIALNSFLKQTEMTLDLIAKNRDPSSFYHYSLYTKFNKNTATLKTPNQQGLTKSLNQSVSEYSGEALHKVNYTMSWSLSRGQDYMFDIFRNYQKLEKLSLNQAINLISNFQLYKVYEYVLPVAIPIIHAEQNKRYLVETDVLIKTPDGATISAVVVRKRGDNIKRPSAFQFTIYTDDKWATTEAMHAAAHGYIGVIANTRGKGKSTDKIIPWEYDGKDATAVIDWISKQSWSDGRVAMYGGSYLGFTQWAAAKYSHPALKTIVPYEAANPMVGLPVENNIFITPNYQWAFHVTNNKTMDNSVYEDWKHWQDTYDNLFSSGRAFKDIDKVEGTPNPWFQKWLSHPSFDSYYQKMMPYKQDFNKINIPVLSITGYFGASISALYFLKEHNRYNKNANHTVLIGPYNHGTAQGIPHSKHSNYKLDEVALDKDTKEITFEWFDHVLFNKSKPKLLKDKFNYQLMGSNSWQHKPSLEKLNQRTKTYHLGKIKSKDYEYPLTTKSQNKTDFIKLRVDMSDRKTQTNLSSWKVIQEKLNEPNGLIFITEAFEQTQQLVGSVTGYFNLSVNKKDVDIGFKFFELKSNGETFKLAHYISRASYAKDMSKRQLLTPNNKTMISIVNSTMTAKLIEKGSRLVMVLNVNKNSKAQVNMGTGKDVSEETIDDAGEPLEIKWFSDSEINIPITPWKPDN
jgi:putative CocE/NonD family hydrolase